MQRIALSLESMAFGHHYRHAFGSLTSPRTSIDVCLQKLMLPLHKECSSGELLNGSCEIVVTEPPIRICPPGFAVRDETCVKRREIPCTGGTEKNKKQLLIDSNVERDIVGGTLQEDDIVRAGNLELGGVMRELEAFGSQNANTHRLLQDEHASDNRIRGQKSLEYLGRNATVSTEELREAELPVHILNNLNETAPSNSVNMNNTLENYKENELEFGPNTRVTQALCFRGIISDNPYLIKYIPGTQNCIYMNVYVDCNSIMQQHLHGYSTMYPCTTVYPYGHTYPYPHDSRFGLGKGTHYPYVRLSVNPQLPTSSPVDKQSAESVEVSSNTKTRTEDIGKEKDKFLGVVPDTGLPKDLLQMTLSEYMEKHPSFSFQALDSLHRSAKYNVAPGDKVLENNYTGESPWVYVVTSI